MNKQKKQMVILGCVLAVLVAAAVIIKVATTLAAQGDSELQPVKIETIEPDDITRVVVENHTQEAAMTFLREGDDWVYQEDPNFPLRGSFITAITSGAGNLSAVRQLEGSDSMEAYGLDEESAIRVTIANDAGDEVVIFIGDEVDSYYYMKVEGSDSVYTIMSTLYNEVAYSLYDMAEKPELPDYSAETVTSLTVRSPYQPDLTLTQEVEVKTSEDEVSETIAHWYQEDGTEVTDMANVSQVMDELGSITFAELYAYQPDGAAVSACGLDEPKMTLVITSESDGEEETHTLYVGLLDEDSRTYYARLDEDVNIYLVNADSIQALCDLAVNGVNDTYGSAEES